MKGEELDPVRAGTLRVTLVQQEGVCHAYLTGWQNDEAALSMAIFHACEKAVCGYNFEGIAAGPDGNKALWFSRKHKRRTNQSRSSASRGDN